jgi:malate/lactate dehydrogenase
LVDRSGVRGRIMNKLTEEENEKLKMSADKLKAVIAQIEY